MYGQPEGTKGDFKMTFTFYFLSTLILYGAMGTVFKKNPIACALHLALTMIALAGLFFQLGAQFIAGVQLVVYAGAVMVLFVLVVMLFDNTQKQKEDSVLKTPFLALKTFICVFILGLLSGVIPHSVGTMTKIVSPRVTSTQELAYILFSDYVFLFEWLGLLLLVIAVGIVLLSRSKGE